MPIYQIIILSLAFGVCGLILASNFVKNMGTALVIGIITCIVSAIAMYRELYTLSAIGFGAFVLFYVIALIKNKFNRR